MILNLSVSWASTCTVKGIEGLHVADASIIPDCIRAPTMTIGKRHAEFI